MLVVVPSRTELPHVQQLKTTIDERVKAINEKFATPNWTPIIYLYKPLCFDELVAVYSISDVAFVTPLRDGMNLISKEYVAARTSRDGVLILSRTAGASKELSQAILVDPTNISEISDALARALDMKKNEQTRRMTLMQERGSIL